MPNMWANENHKVDTRSQELNSGPYNCEADGLPHDHGQQCLAFPSPHTHTNTAEKYSALRIFCAINNQQFWTFPRKVLTDFCLTLSQTSPGFYVSAVQVF